MKNSNKGDQMRIISTPNAPQAIGPYSQAIVVNEMVYTSGQIGLTPNGKMSGDDIESQTHQVMRNLSKVLEEAGSDLGHVIKTTIFLEGMHDFEQVNKIYTLYFGDHKPARSTVAVKTLPRNALVEIDCIAVVI
jgi:2-iminobutanoate/2-iminopropanoate deaminase